MAKNRSGTETYWIEEDVGFGPEDTDLEVEYTYSPGDPGCRTMSNGDPGWPPSGPEVQIQAIWEILSLPAGKGRPTRYIRWRHRDDLFERLGTKDPKDTFGEQLDEYLAEEASDDESDEPESDYESEHNPFFLD